MTGQVLQKAGVMKVCEANVYLVRHGQEELVMEKVDRVIPKADSIFMENVVGERRVIKARIKEMELVHHRILLEEIEVAARQEETEIWLEPMTDHGHFHPGEEVRLRLLKGYNLHPVIEPAYSSLQAFVVEGGETREVELEKKGAVVELTLGKGADGLITAYAVEKADIKHCYAKVIVEIGHHHHHQLMPVGIPLEIVPAKYSHVHLGDPYEFQVLYEGSPLPGAEVKASYPGVSGRDYPIQMTTDDGGKARVFLMARGNWLFSVKHQNITSTFTLVKDF